MVKLPIPSPLPTLEILWRSFPRQDWILWVYMCCFAPNSLAWICEQWRQTFSLVYLSDIMVKKRASRSASAFCIMPDWLFTLTWIDWQSLFSVCICGWEGPGGYNVCLESGGIPSLSYVVNSSTHRLIASIVKQRGLFGLASHGIL